MNINDMNVPFLDINLGNISVRYEIESAIKEVITRGAFAGGPFVDKFEEDFAAYCGAKYAVGVGSGTEALWLALLALGVGPGDEVITVPSTFMATAEAISFTGARPVFVDIDERTYTMDPAGLKGVISPKSKAVIPVHLFGQPADMDPIAKIANEYGLHVVEDAAQAHGAEYKGRKAGTIGDIGCFSFYPGKNLGAFGEAGAVVTNKLELHDKMRILRDHGQIRKYHHTMIGWNCRMDGIQGAVLQVKLRHLDKGNQLRRAHAVRYDRALSDVEELVTPPKAPWVRHAYHIYSIRVQRRSDVMRYLGERGVGCGIHYPIPVHLQEAYRSLGYAKGSFPIAERCAAEFLSLPMFPELTNNQLDYVLQIVREAVASGVTA